MSTQETSVSRLVYRVRSGFLRLRPTISDAYKIAQLPLVLLVPQIDLLLSCYQRRLQLFLFPFLLSQVACSARATLLLYMLEQLRSAVERGDDCRYGSDYLYIDRPSQQDCLGFRWYLEKCCALVQQVNRVYLCLPSDLERKWEEAGLPRDQISYLTRIYPLVCLVQYAFLAGYCGP
jgi:hypothetical protein